MRNLKLTIAYDGTDFHGWQIQPGQPTVQGVLSEIAQQITQEPITIHGAARTDAGVHAWGQVVSFKTHSELSPHEFHRAFNALLPPTVRVRDAEEAGPDFHARWQAQAKTYRYRIFRGRTLSPFSWRYVLHERGPLDLAAMAAAARCFEGEHDFSSFAASTGSPEEDDTRSPIRTIYSSELLQCQSALQGAATVAFATTEAPQPEECAYLVRGKSFLRYMVRKIVGTLLEVGRGRLSPSDIPQLFESRDRIRSGPTVPPHGLCLESIEYPDPTNSLAAKNPR